MARLLLFTTKHPARRIVLDDVIRGRKKNQTHTAEPETAKKQPGSRTPFRTPREKISKKKAMNVQLLRNMVRAPTPPPTSSSSSSSSTKRNRLPNPTQKSTPTQPSKRQRTQRPNQGIVWPAPRPVSSGKKRQLKSRPSALANMCLALETHARHCHDSGQPFDLTPESLLRIIHDQSGSKAHHAPTKRNQCEDRDPLRHLLTQSTLCGAGTNAPVFRPDTHLYGLRNWPELVLGPILDSLDRMKRDWHAIVEQQTTPAPPGPHRTQTPRGTETQQQFAQRVTERLLEPMEHCRVGFGLSRPMW